ncbi:hypothetical protein DTO212C5_1718 [Paecilomyces variotii]|nr:hypothetical protein DTO212C5_1718 [Paecilomyces variotii]
MRAEDYMHPSSSPRTSNGGASHHDSPDTKLTTYSPEDLRSKGVSGPTACSASSEDELREFYAALGPDPFIAPPTGHGRVQLSPTASSFTPLGPASGTDQSSARLLKSIGSGVRYLAANSEPDHGLLRKGNERLPDQIISDFGPIGKAKTGNEHNHSSPIIIGQFDQERRSRAFVIEDVPTGLSYLTLAGFFSRREFRTLKGPVLSELRSKGRISVAFTDSREAQTAMNKIHHLRPEWRIHPLTAKEYAQRQDMSLSNQVSDFEGQIFVSVYYDSRDPNLHEQGVAQSLKDLAETFGDLKLFHAVPTGQDNVSDFLIEFFDTRDSENVVVTLNGTSVNSCLLEVKFYKPDVNDGSSRNAVATPMRQISPLRGNAGNHLYPSSTMGSLGRVPHSPYFELSPTGRSTVPRGERAGLMEWTRFEERNVYPPRAEISRYSDPRSTNQNFVDVERIRCGLDVRTTIMLRNIPNKIDQAILKEIVDETSRGKYDFMYLRIDFANNCNVGYAFINFEDPIDIIDFVNARSGRNWNCFNSDKVAEISYASYSSSLANNLFSDTSQIFHTGTGPLAGTEDRFPGPDNPSKMRRSVENAEHVGLFAPRVGQQYRDEQRRRRSQYDRGTTAAEREIVYVRTCTPRRTPAMMSGPRSAPLTLPAFKPWYESQSSPRGPKTS